MCVCVCVCVYVCIKYFPKISKFNYVLFRNRNDFYQTKYHPCPRILRTSI